MHVNAALIGVVGFAVQWLRQYRWFNDGLVLMLALVAGWLSAMMSSDCATLKECLPVVFEHTLTLLGGTMTAHMASHVTPMVPKFNNGGAK